VVASTLALAAAAGQDGAATSYTQTFESPAALAQAVLDALGQRDLERLEGLALSEAEFKQHVWPELPAARPERNVPMDYVWGDLSQKSRNSLRRTFAAHAGQKYELVAVIFDGETTQHETFTVQRKGRCVVRDGAGRERKLALFGSVLEHGGRYKLFSFVND
jgi:hypothetical protein